MKKPIALLKEYNIEVGKDAAIEIRKNIALLLANYRAEIAIIPDWEKHGHELLKNPPLLLVKINSRGGAIP